MKDYNVSPHFLRSEVECHHCHKVGRYAANMRKLLRKLEALRAFVGKPVNLTCAYRCPIHNANVGGIPGSLHTKGMAADLFVSGMPVNDLARAADQVGFGGIGRYIHDEFVHVDIGPRSRWTK